MRVVVHRVDAPFVAGADVVGALDAVDDRVAHVDVGRGHVDLGAQHHGAVGEFAVTHAREQIQVLFRRTVAARAVLAGLGQRAAIFAHLFRRQVVHIGQTLVDQLNGKIVQRIEIVRRPAHFAVPLKSQPAHVVLDGLRVFRIFLLRIGVVEAQVAQAVVIPGQTEVQADGFGVTNMKITIRLRRESGDDALMLAAGEVAVNNRADEIGDGRCWRGGVAAHFLFKKC